MFNKDIFRLYQCAKFPIVNIGDIINTIFSINYAFSFSEHPEYPHSVVSHLLSLSCGIIDVSLLEELVISSIKLGWRPTRDDVSDYEKLCIKKICAFIDDYNNSKDAKKGGVYNGKTKKRQKSKA